MFHYQIKLKKKQAEICYRYNQDDNYCDYPVFFKPKNSHNIIFCVVHGTSDGLINNIGVHLTVKEFYDQNRTLLDMLRCKKLYVISCMGGLQKESWIKIDGVEIKQIITSVNEIDARFNTSIFGGTFEFLTDNCIEKTPYVKLL
jgi:hypothetical protein